jgi:hypothetical protein
MAEELMRKLLFAFLALTACANDSSTDPVDDPGSDTGSDGGGGGGGGGGGSGSGSGGEVSTTDRQQDYDDVAVSIGANVNVGELGTMFDAFNMAYGRLPDGFVVTQGPDYQLVDGTRNGLAIQYKLFCRDVADLYTPCNGAEDHAHVKVTYSGAAAGAATAMDGVQRTASWIVRDFTLPNPRVGGNGTDAFSAHLATGDYALTFSDLVDHVRFSTAPIDIVSGAIEMTVSVQRTRAEAVPADRAFDVGVRVEFRGGDLAAIILDEAETYNLTLSTGAVVKAI